MTESNFLESVLTIPGMVPNSGMNPAKWVESLNRLLDALEFGLRNNYENIFISDIQINVGLEKLHHIRLFSENNRPNPAIAFADIIDTINPSTSCSGQTLYIKGNNFGKPMLGSTHPNDKVLLLPSNPTPWDVVAHSKIAEVPLGHWKDTHINLPLPNWVGVGNIGFLNLIIQQQWDNYTEELNQLFHDFFIWLRNDIGLNSEPSFPPSRTQNPRFEIQAPMDTPPPTGRNYLIAGLPAIKALFVNGKYNCTVEPENTVTISWDVFNAINVTIDVFLQNSGEFGRGSWSIIYQGDLLQGSCQYQPPSERAYDHTIRLTATNPCGPKVTHAYIHIRKQPAVVIKGIEVIQSIQEYSFDDQTRQNIVPLFQGKRTMVRVYLDSGLPANFNSGWLSNVTGNLRFNGASHFPLCPSNIPPFNASTVRSSLGNSLNFLLYDEALNTSEMTFEVEVFSHDPNLNWGRIRQSCTVKVEIPRIIDIYYFLVRDANGNETSYEEVGASLDRLRSIYPISWRDGINIKGIYLLDTDLDFNDDDSWYSADFTSSDLFDLLEEAANELDDNGEIFCAIVPENACNKAKGYGWPGGLDWIGGTSQRIAYWRATKGSDIGNYIEAHEVGHALNLCDIAGSINITGVDLRHPNNPYLRQPLTEQMMEKKSNERWINPSEYLWIHYLDFETTVLKSIELGLAGELSVFYLGI